MPSATGISLSVSLACANGFNQINCQVFDGMLHEVGMEPMYQFSVIIADSGTLYSPLSTSTSYTFENVLNGEYGIQASASDGRESLVLWRNGSCVEEPPAPVCDLHLLGAPQVTNETAPAAADGTITVTAESTAANIQIRATPNGQPADDWRAGVTSGQPFVISGQAPGTYTVQARDGNGCITSPVQVTVAAFAKAGCTDPTATNYDPAATENNGTCTYAPKPVIPFFDVPMMNSLRFVKSEPAPDYRTTFNTPDNTLQCAQRLRNVKNIGYEQKVDKQDALAIQFRSNYTTHLVEVLNYYTDEVLGTFPAEKRIANTSKTAQFITLLKAHTTGKTRVYFEESLFNFDVASDQVLIISNAGTYDGQYTITGIGQDTATSNPYFIINKPFAGPGESVGASVFAEYDVFPYDIFETEIDFTAIPAGSVYARITATDARPEFSPADAISEPINLLPHHADTYLIKYRNLDSWADIDYSTGIYHMLRIEANLHQPKPGGEREIHRNSNGSIVKLSAQKKRIFKFSTYMLPAWLHEKLGVVFDYDSVSINGVKVQTEDDYEVSYIDTHNLSNGSIEVEQVQWFGNNNNGHDLGNVDGSTGGRIIVNGGFLKY